MAAALPSTDPGVDPDRFALAPAPDNVAVRKLLFEGRGVTDVAGADVVAHYEIEGVGWLVIADHDSRFQDAVEVHPLDLAFRLLETRRTGGPYVAGAIDDVRRTGAASVAFTFPGRERTWQVVVE